MNFFGTDGIRGTYGSTITDGTAYLLGKSLALLGGDGPIIIICRDTRLSGENLFNALAQGVYSGGGNVINLGILPTNSVGHFVRKLGGDYGVMISASHNPPEDNGLKVFDRYGVKLCRAKQNVVSKMMNSLLKTVPEGKVYEPVFYDIDNIYCEDIASKADVKLTGLSVALDCCYGASYKVAKKLFSMLGAKVTAYCDRDSGKMINIGCGATHTEFLQNKLFDSKCQLGFAFDGDCDRLAVFEGNKLVDNNAVFLAMARFMKEKGRLAKNTVAGTVLTNSGLEKALNASGIKLIRSDVGDINIFEKMAKEGLTLGGEESGHYILSEFATSSDALVSALYVCKIYLEKGSILSYTADYAPSPFCKLDIPLTSGNAALAADYALAAAVDRLGSVYPDCRIVLRKSGTEPKIRAYAEGEHCEDAVKSVAATFAEEPCI